MYLISQNVTASTKDETKDGVMVSMFAELSSKFKITTTLNNSQRLFPHFKEFFSDNFQNHGNHVSLEKPLEKIGELQQLKQVILE